MRPIPRWALLATASAFLLLLGWAYWPGLGGPFLLDDYGNLDVLGTYGRIHDWPEFLYYASSGHADPTGRPIALLSFLLDASSWPADPWPFKRTNLALHLLNTVLLAAVLVRLQSAWSRRHPPGAASPWTPLAAAGIWGAHPFLVSTTLYVVQREAMLAMSFVLLAVLAWDRAVACFGRQRNVVGWTWAAGMAVATLLAGLSKANGSLAPVLVGLAYLWFLRPQTPASSTRSRVMDRAALLCLGLPSLLLAMYLLQAGWHLWSIPQLPGRDWSLPERLLSEPRAIWSYVWRLVVPRAGAGGLYVDDFAASRGWLQPATTLPAMLMLLASIVAAIRLRQRFPIASFAWLFFLAAHLLEGSTIPLELYFEHRNYLPAAFLGWPVAHVLLRPGGRRMARAALAAVILGGLLLLTHQRALAWGDAALLDALSGEHQADSPRAQVVAAGQELEQGDVRAGLSRIHAMQRRHPDSVDIAINAISFECAGTGALAADTLARSRQALRSAVNWNYQLYQWMQDAAVDTGLRGCRGFGLHGLKALVASAESNPQNVIPARRRELWHVRGRIALAEGRPTLALRWFDAALKLRPAAEYALVQAAALGNAGAQALGVRHLDLYERIQLERPPEPVHDMASAHAWLLRHYGFYTEELSSLRQRLQADADLASKGAPPTR